MCRPPRDAERHRRPEDRSYPVLGERSQAMSERKFRFGVVAPLAQTLDQWTTTARWAEDVGYDVLLSPDAVGVAAPFVSLSAAAAVTTRLRLGTFVLNVPLRATGSIAWDTASLDRASGGRFELGLGAGRPDGAREAELFGMPWGTPKQRVQQVDETISGIRRIFADAVAADAKAAGQPFGGGGFLRPEQWPHPPIMIAAAGRSLLGLAAREADIIAFGLAGGAGEDELTEKIRIVRAAAGDRFDAIELSVNVWSAVGSSLPPWMSGMFGVDPAAATDNRVLSVLNGTPREVADVLTRRRDQLGISYITINSLAMEAFVPVLELLKGR
jgi:probable F420-dependent oxidoreductase